MKNGRVAGLETNQGHLLFGKEPIGGEFGQGTL